MRDWPRHNQWRDAAANLQSELDAFEQRNVALHLIIRELETQEKDAPRVRVENYSTYRLTVAGKKATILLSLF